MHVYIISFWRIITATTKVPKHPDDDACLNVINLPKFALLRLCIEFLGCNFHLFGHSAWFRAFRLILFRHIVNFTLITIKIWYRITDFCARVCAENDSQQTSFRWFTQKTLSIDLIIKFRQYYDQQTVSRSIKHIACSFVGKIVVCTIDGCDIVNNKSHGPA